MVPKILKNIFDRHQPIRIWNCETLVINGDFIHDIPVYFSRPSAKQMTVWWTRKIENFCRSKNEKRVGSWDKIRVFYQQAVQFFVCINFGHTNVNNPNFLTFGWGWKLIEKLFLFQRSRGIQKRIDCVEGEWEIIMASSTIKCQLNSM